MQNFQFNDGGRAVAGFKGSTGDCVCRAVAIASEKPYAEIYAKLAKGNCEQHKSKHAGRASGQKTASHGINVRRKWFKDFMNSLGFTWVPTMTIGSGCKVHLLAEELPLGRLVIAVSKHYTCMIDGVINDTWDPRREAHVVESDLGQALKPGQWRNVNGICSIQRRCVYGYFIKG